MRLLLFIHSLMGGGAERVAANLANHWAAKAWDVTIVTLAAKHLDAYELDPRIDRIALGFVDEHRGAARDAWKNVRRVGALRRVLKDVRPDVALSLMGPANVLLALARRGVPNVRAIGSEHTFPPRAPLGALRDGLRRVTYRGLDAVVALTSEGARWLEVCTSARMAPVIPNPVAWPLPALAETRVPVTLRAPERRVLLAVGRLSAEKNYAALLAAFAGIAPRHPDWDLVILGEGPDRSDLESDVRTLGLGDRAFLPGRAGNVGQWYARAELFALSSRFEGFPNALVEAMAHGVPAVSVDCDTGPRDIVRHDIDGVLVPPDDTAALATAMDRLMGDADLRARFAARAGEARTRFSMDRIAGMWERLFVALRD